MKIKALEFALLAAVALPSVALAQVESTPTASLRADRVTRIPDYFTCDVNSVQIAVLTNNECTAEIYDLEFNLLRSFDVIGSVIEMQWDDGHGSNYNNYIYFTQSFFNDDDKYEYLITTDSGQTLSIVSEDGTIIQTIVPFEDSNFSYRDGIDLWSFWDGYDWHTSYLKINRDGGDSYDWQFFRVDKNISSGIAEQQSEMLTMQATREGDTLNVGFEPSSTDRTLNVVSTNGMNVLSCSVAAGESAANIDTRRFVSGVYVVTLQEPGKAAVETTKIIIR